MEVERNRFTRCLEDDVAELTDGPDEKTTQAKDDSGSWFEQLSGW